MHQCGFRSSCDYHNELKESKPVILESVKEAFCDTNFSRCARFMLYQMKAPYNVSKHLFPEDIDEASIIMQNITKSGAQSV